jgi:hypothetical protein
MVAGIVLLEAQFVKTLLQAFTTRSAARIDHPNLKFVAAAPVIAGQDSIGR